MLSTLILIIDCLELFISCYHRFIRDCIQVALFYVENNANDKKGYQSQLEITVLAVMYNEILSCEIYKMSREVLLNKSQCSVSQWSSMFWGEVLKICRKLVHNPLENGHLHHIYIFHYTPPPATVTLGYKPCAEKQTINKTRTPIIRHH